MTTKAYNHEDDKPVLAFLGPEHSFTHQVRERLLRYMMSLTLIELSRQATVKSFSDEEWEFVPSATIEGTVPSRLVAMHGLD